MTIDDFNVSPSVNMARMVNWLGALQIGGIYQGDAMQWPSFAVARVARFVDSHQSQRPATEQDIQWRTVDALLTHIHFAGPRCSSSDVSAAIQAFPGGYDQLPWPANIDEG